MKGPNGYTLNVMGDEIIPSSMHCEYLNGKICGTINPNFECMFMNSDRVRCNKVIPA